jgi:hypothetical protein
MTTERVELLEWDGRNTRAILSGALAKIFMNNDGPSGRQTDNNKSV